MKVYFIVDMFPKLSETFILQQITGLIDAGYDVRIIARVKGGKKECQPEIRTYSLLSKVVYLNIPKNYLKLACRVIAFYLLRLHFLFKYNFRSRYKILVVGILPFLADCDINKDDVVICNFGTIGIQAALLKQLGRTFRLITIFHGFDLSMFLENEQSDVYKEVFKYSDRLLPVSDFWQKKLIAFGAPKQKVEVFHMGIDLKKYDLPLLHHKKFTFVSVGRFVEKKGFLYSIQAFAKALPELGGNVEYKIVGDGPLFGECEELIKKLGVQRHVRLLGSKNSSEIQKILQKCDVFIVPSATASNGDMEGIPIVMLEAEAMGLPVVATDHSGLKEGLSPEQTRFLVEERDVNGLASSLIRLYEDITFRRTLGSNGRRHIKGEFNIKLQVSKLEQYIYE